MTMVRQMFVNKETKREFEVVGKDVDSGDLVLKGEGGVTFKQPFNPKQFKALGYELKVIKDEEEDDEDE